MAPRIPITLLICPLSWIEVAPPVLFVDDIPPYLCKQFLLSFCLSIALKKIIWLPFLSYLWCLPINTNVWFVCIIECVYSKLSWFSRQVRHNQSSPPAYTSFQHLEMFDHETWKPYGVMQWQTLESMSSLTLKTNDFLLFTSTNNHFQLFIPPSHISVNFLTDGPGRKRFPSSLVHLASFPPTTWSSVVNVTEVLHTTGRPGL
jgi:hypothetical protein